MKVTYLREGDIRRVVAYLDGPEPVGQVVWTSGGLLLGIQVDENHRGQGIATALWEYANSEAVPEAERPPRPKEEEYRTPEGEALYWKARGRREAREAGETPPSALKE